MLINFFLHLKSQGLPVSIREYLDLLTALQLNLVDNSIDEFYPLARSLLIKDERLFDKFDVAFAGYLHAEAGMQENPSIPSDWLTKQMEKHLSEQEKKAIESLGGFEQLMDTFAQRLKEQQSRHQGGNKWIGTAGTSPFGAYGYNPEGIRIGQDSSRHRRAVKVWDKREFANLDDNQALEQRNVAIALRRLREFSRDGVAEELDLKQTIAKTASNGGLLNLVMQPSKKNTVKVLMLYDVGGSMDDHIELTATLFKQAKTAFKHMEFYYFHNCIYESLWQDNRRRQDNLQSTMSVINRYAKDYKLIIVGDALMSPYEILFPGGSVEHMNQEAGNVWLRRLMNHFSSVAWLNPLPKAQWQTHSVSLINDILDKRMYELTVNGIGQAIAQL